ncbi:hypothetical protein [Bordetella flabilis]|uniref:hypothetical protein n=1 Tax=Bordetella flabilis TaxID=463014 RepID=UPI003AAD5690
MRAAHHASAAMPPIRTPSATVARMVAAVKSPREYRAGAKRMGESLLILVNTFTTAPGSM